LYVIDLRTNAVVKTIPGVPGIEGVAYIPEGKKVYTSNWYENKIGVVDLGQMAVTKKVVDVREDRIVKTLKFDSETGVPQ